MKNLYFNIKYFCTSENICHFKTLGLNKTASKEEIKKAYYKMAKIYHPDISNSKINLFTNKIRRVIMKRYSKRLHKLMRFYTIIRIYQ